MQQDVQTVGNRGVMVVHWKRTLRWLGLWFLLCTYSSLSSFADEETLQVRMNQIQKEAEATEAVLDRLKSEFKVLQDKRRGIDHRIGKLAEDISSLNERLQLLEQERDRLIARVRDAEQELVRVRSNIRGRIRAVYERSVIGSPPLLVRVMGEKNRYELSYYSRKIRAHDSRRFDRLAEALTELKSAQKVLGKSYSAEQEARDLLLQAQKSLENERVGLVALLSTMKQKQAAAKQSLVRLQGKARVLEQLLQNLLQREDFSSKKTSSVSQSDSSRIEAPPDLKLNRLQDVDLRLPSGLFTKGLKVLQPVSGRVVRGFGKTRVRSFSDIVFSKGIELQVNGTEVVHSIAPGRVAFAGAMPGYDNVVIVDHGARSYSLYGRLERFNVRVGEMIPGGSTLGMTSKQGSQSGRPFYFEIRKDGKPVDPTSLVVF